MTGFSGNAVIYRRGLNWTTDSSRFSVELSVIIKKLDDCPLHSIF